MLFPISLWGMDHIFIPLLHEGALRMASEDSQDLSTAMISSSLRRRASRLGSSGSSIGVPR
jgi:hypothetical protein